MGANLPNCFTIGRMLLVPVTVWALIVVFLTLASFAVYMQLRLAHITAEDTGPKP